jgi:hypothetical protein
MRRSRSAPAGLDRVNSAKVFVGKTSKAQLTHVWHAPSRITRMGDELSASVANLGKLDCG